VPKISLGLVAMNQSLPTNRMKFAEVEIGARFYDALSQEFFVKFSGTQAVMVTGRTDGVTPDDFEPEDPVRM
jgi:hypothetical protein